MWAPKFLMVQGAQGGGADGRSANLSQSAPGFLRQHQPMSWLDQPTLRKLCSMTKSLVGLRDPPQNPPQVDRVGRASE